ncbi:metalloregulator ArsR/SmtB family transcription factor [bacterium]|nr:metalloregulator ArsR/SmtB family transcription factor [bacterium]MBU1982972.1 metalloregulator ArsR/SmtB family transcription factor [bacterium]
MTRELAPIFRAAADETRLRILSLLLRHEELCVCDFMHVLEITQSKASRHLRYLLNAGFLKDRREGVWMHYRLPERLGNAQRAILEAVREAIPPAELAELERRLQTWRGQRSCEAASADIEKA